MASSQPSLAGSARLREGSVGAGVEAARSIKAGVEAARSIEAGLEAAPAGCSSGEGPQRARSDDDHERRCKSASLDDSKRAKLSHHEEAQARTLRSPSSLS